MVAKEVLPLPLHDTDQFRQDTQPLLGDLFQQRNW